jgi:hypothetical protein
LCATLIAFYKKIDDFPRLAQSIPILTNRFHRHLATAAAGQRIGERIVRNRFANRGQAMRRARMLRSIGGHDVTSRFGAPHAFDCRPDLNMHDMISN